MKKDDKRGHDTERRNFLRGSMATGLGVAATTLPGSALADTAEPSQDQSSPEEARGYRLTGHVLDYYKTLTS